jgi:hypothetical protein
MSCGGETFSNVVRAAIPEGMMMIMYRSFKHGVQCSILREAKLCFPPSRYQW